MPSPLPWPRPWCARAVGCCSCSPTEFPRIHGGHLCNRIRVADAPLISSREGVDLLVALNQETVHLHQEELAPDGW